MLQKAPYNADDIDVIRLPRDMGDNAADAADNHLNLYASLGSFSQFIDELALGDGIHL